MKVPDVGFLKSCRVREWWWQQLAKARLMTLSLGRVPPLGSKLIPKILNRTTPRIQRPSRKIQTWSHFESEYQTPINALNMKEKETFSLECYCQKVIPPPRSGRLIYIGLVP